LKPKIVIIGLTGVSGVGKSSAAEVLRDSYRKGGNPARVINLSDPMKKFCEEMFGFSYNSLYGPAEHRADPHPVTGVVPRLALQQLGSWGRSLQLDLWLSHALKTIDMLSKKGFTRFIIPDIRFRNEADKIKEIGGAIYRLKREGVKPQKTLKGGIKNHDSEVEQMKIPDSEFTKVITLGENYYELIESAREVGWFD